MGCYYNQYHKGNTLSWIFHQMNSSDFALRATTGQEGWGQFCHVVDPTGKPEDIRSSVVKGSR